MKYLCMNGHEEHYYPDVRKESVFDSRVCVLCGETTMPRFWFVFTCPSHGKFFEIPQINASEMGGPCHKCRREVKAELVDYAALRV